MKKNGKSVKLRDFKASLKLKQNVNPSYHEARKFPVFLLALAVAKLRKLIERDLFEHVPPGGRKWTLPNVVLRKSNGDIRICRDYKIGVKSPSLLCLILKLQFMHWQV